MSRSRLIPLALVVTLLLAVVAITARGRPLGSAGGSHGGLPGSFWDYTYTTVVVVVVPLLLLGLIAAMHTTLSANHPWNCCLIFIRMPFQQLVGLVNRRVLLHVLSNLLRCGKPDTWLGLHVLD